MHSQSKPQQPLLSIVIPALNEERRLPESLVKIDCYLSKQCYTYEVIVVENGSSDDTAGIVQRFAIDHPYVRLFTGEPRGKGRAVRRGMLEAKGEYRFICDSDLSMPIEEIAKFLPPQLSDYDVAIGSREALGAKRYNEPIKRHIMGRINNLWIKLIVLRGFEDTQCGFKCFRRETAEDLFRAARLNGIGFDVELIYLAKKRGYKIMEIPINWYYNTDTRMLLVKDTLAMFQEIFEIRQNWGKGLYKK